MAFALHLAGMHTWHQPQVQSAGADQLTQSEGCLGGKRPFVSTSRMEARFRSIEPDKANGPPICSDSVPVNDFYCARFDWLGSTDAKKHQQHDRNRKISAPKHAAC